MYVNAAISYVLETESQRRKQGLHSRVSFLDKKPTDQDFQSTGMLELRGQNKKTCHKVKLRLQVLHPQVTTFLNSVFSGIFYSCVLILYQALLLLSATLRSLIREIKKTGHCKKKKKKVLWHSLIQ